MIASAVLICRLPFSVLQPQATDNATAKLDKQFIHYVANLTSFVYGSQSVRCNCTLLIYVP